MMSQFTAKFHDKEKSKMKCHTRECVNGCGTFMVILSLNKREKFNQKFCTKCVKVT